MQQGRRRDVAVGEGRGCRWWRESTARVAGAHGARRAWAGERNGAVRAVKGGVVCEPFAGHTDRAAADGGLSQGLPSGRVRLVRPARGGTEQTRAQRGGVVRDPQPTDADRAAADGGLLHGRASTRSGGSVARLRHAQRLGGRAAGARRRLHGTARRGVAGVAFETTAQHARAGYSRVGTPRGGAVSERRYLCTQSAHRAVADRPRRPGQAARRLAPRRLPWRGRTPYYGWFFPVDGAAADAHALVCV